MSGICAACVCSVCDVHVNFLVCSVFCVSYVWCVHGICVVWVFCVWCVRKLYVFCFCGVYIVYEL